MSEMTGVVAVLGIDLAKRVFALHGVDESGKPVLKQVLSRSALTKRIAQLPPCLIGLEACSGAHEWARQFQRFGHVVKLIAPSICNAVSQVGQERRQRRGGHLRGSESAQHALRSGEDA